MIPACLHVAALLLFPIAQAGTQQQEATILNYGSVASEPLANGEVLYHLRQIDLRSPTLTLRADRGRVRFHGERYSETAQGTRLIGDIGADLLGSPGQPVKEPLILEIQLEGNVYMETPERIVECDWMVQLPGEGRATLHRAKITIPGDIGPNGWPWRLRADVLEEAADGSLFARNAAVTACHLTDPAYALTMRELRATLDENGAYIWSPASTWLSVRDQRVLPMPSFDFQAGSGDSGFGVRSLRMSSGRQLGTALELGMSYKTHYGDDPFELSLLPSYSTRRGTPLRTRAEYSSDRLSTSWDLFYLADGATDVHALSRFVGRGSDQRWRLRSDTRYELSDFWRLDVDLNLTSDPLVDPEFFRREWTDARDSLNELYLRRVDAQSLFTVTADYRLDDVGFTPIEGYGARGGAAPQQLDLLPRLRYEKFSTTIASLPVGALGGHDGRAPVNLSWGADAGRFRLRELELTPALASLPFTPSGDESRDRAQAWIEVVAPMNWRGLTLSPGVRVEGGAVSDPGALGGSDAQASTEVFLEASSVFERRSEDGWLHRLRPAVRLRNLEVLDRPGAEWFPFEAFDQRRSGQAAEFSLRQFWYGEASSQPWLDVNLLVPYYPSPSEALADGVFPGFRSGQRTSSWGPAEMRVVWTPGVERGLLRGVRATTNLRQNFREGELEEIFSSLSVSPNPNWRVATWLRSLSDTAITDAFASSGFRVSWRINETWSFEAGQTFTQRGDSATNSRYGFTYHGHGFAFELSASRNEATGESRYSFNLLPCFLTEPYYGANL